MGIHSCGGYIEQIQIKETYIKIKGSAKEQRKQCEDSLSLRGGDTNQSPRTMTLQ